MKLHWLQLKKPCVLEIREVKDYAGQPLVFRPPGLSRRCVTDAGLQHRLVQRYLKQLVIEEVDRTGKPVCSTLKAAPTVEVATEPPPPLPTVEPTPEPEPEPVIEPELTPEPVIEPELTPEPPELEETEESEEPDESVSDSSSDSSSRRGRRRNKR